MFTSHSQDELEPSSTCAHSEAFWQNMLTQGIEPVAGHDCESTVLFFHASNAAVCMDGLKQTSPSFARVTVNHSSQSSSQLEVISTSHRTGGQQ